MPTEAQMTAKMCRASYAHFVRTMWSIIVKEPLRWNWHIQLACDELQYCYERVFAWKPKEYDLMLNQPPGTTKSIIHSVMSVPWAWTRMPHLRFLGASYSGTLAEKLSMYSRDVIKSELYRACFPRVKIRSDKDTLSHFINTDGGERYATGSGGSATGLIHAHIICLPWKSRVTTDCGPIPIGRIVDDHLRVNILGFDHATGCPRWQRIEAYERSPGRPLCRVRFSDGTFLDLTADHPVFVPGRGYVPPTLLRGGDVVYDASQLRPVRQAVPDHPVLAEIPSGEVEEWQALLHARLSAGVQKVSRQVLRGLRRRIEATLRDEQILRHRLSVGSPEGAGSPPVGCERKEGLPPLWLELHAGQGDTAPDLLFAGLRGHGPQRAYGRGRERQLHARAVGCALQLGLSPVAASGQEAGGVCLFPVPQDGDGNRSEVIGPSHRLRRVQQRTGEFGGAVPVLPRRDARQASGPAGLGTKTVSDVVFGLRIPATVYNVRVAEDHNYFAEGVLVHNCVDDPINPEQALSEAEMGSINHWMVHTLLNRKVDKSVSFTHVVGQRLAQGDPYDTFKEVSPRVKHFVIPADLDYEVKPPELAANYVDGLMDPIRHPKVSLDEEKAKGDHYYAGQFGQSPVPAGGGTFKTAMIRAGRPPGLYKTVVRFWDKAGTGDFEAKRRTAYTAGVKMAEDTLGRFWVLGVVRGRWDSYARERVIRRTAIRDRRSTIVGQEQEPGSGGKDQARGSTRRLKGFRVITLVSRGKKETRAEEYSVQVNAGNVWLPEQFRQGNDWVGWAKDYVEELKYWPFAVYKDQGDASAGAFSILSRAKIVVGPIPEDPDKAVDTVTVSG